MPRPANPFATIKEWRAKDRHTGIAVVGAVPCAYKHLVGRAIPSPRADVYRVESFLHLVAPRPLHLNVHYVPGSELDEFFATWGEHAETVIDIRPLTIAEAHAELAAFQQSLKDDDDDIAPVAGKDGRR